jgi:FKBP-type peptidyl-prolyl cis-trans isomerase
VIADLEDLDLQAAVRDETIRAAEEKTKNLRMPIADLEAVYVANGKTAAWAAARADYIEQVVLGKVTASKPVNQNEEADAVRAETIRAAEQEAKNLRLNAAGLKAVYLANGKSAAWADARVTYIGELVQGKEKTTSEAA